MFGESAASAGAQSSTMLSLVSILMLLSLPHDRCAAVDLAALPPPARQALEDEAAGKPLDHVCAVRADGAVAFRGRVSGSGIVLEVTAGGTVVWRRWEAVGSAPWREP